MKATTLTALCLTALLTACSAPAQNAQPAEPKPAVDPADTAEQSTAETSIDYQLEASSEAQKTEQDAEPLLTKEDTDSMDAGTILTQDQLTQVGVENLFYSEEIPDSVFSRMDGVSFGAGCIVDRSELRYLHVLHWGFDEKTHIGEVVCNKAIATDLLEIFQELYQQSYQIEKLYLVDNYGGDDERSMEDNNSSCFNFRIVKGTDHLSQHAYGRAIDINPLYNPYITSRGCEPTNGTAYVDRDADFPHKIDKNDLCYQLFTEHGFTWGGSWNTTKDYQHFQKKE